jgi:kinase
VKVRKGHASPGPSVALPMPLLTSDGDHDTLLAVKKDWARPTQLDSWEFAEDHCCVDGIVIEPSLLSLNLSGLVVACVCTLKSLVCLDLSYNNLTAAFPAAALYACVKLRYLDLSNNFFSGPLLVVINNLSLVMEHCNLSSNRFSGELPHNVSDLNLVELDLSTN